MSWGWRRSQHRPHSVVPLRAAVAYCGGGGRASPGAFCGCGKRLSSGASPSRAARLWAGCRGPLPACCGGGCGSVGAQHCPLGLHALWGAACRGGGRGRPRAGWPSTIARGVRCQALSLPLPPVLWDGRPGCRDPCVLGAVGVGVGAQHRPHALRGADARRGGGRRACPGGAVHRCEGRLRLGAPPPLAARPPGGLSGSATCAVGAGVRVWGPSTVPLGCVPCGGCVLRGRWGAVTRGAGLPLLRGASGVRYPCAVSSGVRVWGPSTVPLACMPCGGCVPRGWWGVVPGGGELPPL